MASHAAYGATVTLFDALEYHDRGFAVIPVNHKTKAARCKWEKYQTERPAEREIRRWFGGDNQLAIAVVSGPVSGGLVARDFDNLALYDRWADERPRLAKSLPTVATPRPGRHVYMRADVGQIRAVRGGAILDFGPGNGELRGGGYCLLPPSRSPNREKPPYQWLVPLTPELPHVDLYEAGFLPCNTEDTENTGHQLHVLSTLSSPESSVFSAPSVLHDERIELAVACVIPEKGGQRHRMLFELARGLKALPELADAPLIVLKPYVRKWHAAAVGIINTKSFDDSWFDFAESWSRVKFPKGQEPIRMLFAKAIESDLPAEAKQYETPAIQQLVLLCRELQRASGANPFFLGCRTAGELLGVDHATAWRWLRGLQRDGILELVTTGSRGTHQANEYRYLHPL